jgi:hypothetical protein
MCSYDIRIVVACPNLISNCCTKATNKSEACVLADDLLSTSAKPGDETWSSVSSRHSCAVGMVLAPILLHPCLHHMRLSCSNAVVTNGADQ